MSTTMPVERPAGHAAEAIPSYGYLRCSDPRQEKSTGEQRAAIERWARERGYAIAEWFSEEGISGSIF